MKHFLLMDVGEVWVVQSQKDHAKLFMADQVYPSIEHLHVDACCPGLGRRLFARRRDGDARAGGRGRGGGHLNGRGAFLKVGGREGCCGGGVDVDVWAFSCSINPIYANPHPPPRQLGLNATTRDDPIWGVVRTLTTHGEAARARVAKERLFQRAAAS